MGTNHLEHRSRAASTSKRDHHCLEVAAPAHPPSGCSLPKPQRFRKRGVHEIILKIAQTKIKAIARPRLGRNYLCGISCTAEIFCAYLINAAAQTTRCTTCTRKKADSNYKSVKRPPSFCHNHEFKVKISRACTVQKGRIAPVEVQPLDAFLWFSHYHFCLQTKAL